MNTLFLIILLVHGLIHLLGFVKAFHLADIRQLTQPVSKPAGLFWLSASLLFLVTAVCFLTDTPSWWIPAVAGLIVSQALIIRSWKDAKLGTIANLIILLPVIVAVGGAVPSSFQNRYRAQVEKRLAAPSDSLILTEESIRQLPAIVQEYLHVVGAVGKPQLQNFRAVSEGSMKLSKEGRWTDIHAEQYNFYGDRARIFYIRSSLYGIPFDGLHVYVGDSATMQIRLASLFQVVDARGPEMNRGETVTMFNDMCLLAPSTLIDPDIAWEPVDSQTVRARFTNGGNTISATLFFNREGELTNFVSNDRYYTEDGIHYANYPWSTPVREYKEFGGRRVAAVANAVWRMPEGDYTYAKYDLVEFECNRTRFK